LNPLKSSKDYNFKSTGGREYFINVCRPVATETWALKVDKPEDAAGFTRGDHEDFSIGSINTTLSVQDGNPLVVMTGGTLCANAGDLRASTVIRFLCDSSVSGSGEPRLIAQLPPSHDPSCGFFIEWSTEYACPTNEPGNWGFFAIFISLVAVLFFSYIVGGSFYNYFILQLRGFDVIPRYSFISLSDTIEFFRNLVDRMRSSSGNLHLGSGGMGRSWGHSDGGYRGLANSHEEQTSMLGGPPGFLDEEDEEEAAHETGSGAPPPGMDSEGVIRL